MRALTVFGSVLVNPYTLYALKSQIAQNIVRIVPSDNDAPKLDRQSTFLDESRDPKKKNLLQNLIKNFSVDLPFRPVGFCKSFV